MCRSLREGSVRYLHTSRGVKLLVSGTDRLGASRLAGLGGGGGSNGRAGGRDVFVMEESLGDGGEGVQVVGRFVRWRCAGARDYTTDLGWACWEGRLGKF